MAPMRPLGARLAHHRPARRAPPSAIGDGASNDGLADHGSGPDTHHQQQQQNQHHHQQQNQPPPRRVQLPPPPAALAAYEARRAAALARLRLEQPHLDEGALAAYYRNGLVRGGALRHDGPRMWAYLPPSFLQDYPVPPGFDFNVNSFMGAHDAHGGKYFVPAPQLRAFLGRAARAAARGAKLCLSENYNKRAYRHFQELDFDWALPVEAALAAAPRVARIVAEEAAAAHGLEAPPRCVASMRTPYKVHLNFPDVVTTETRARRARRAVINRCRAELAGLPPLAELKEDAKRRAALARAQADFEAAVAEEAALRAARGRRRERRRRWR